MPAVVAGKEKAIEEAQKWLMQKSVVKGKEPVVSRREDGIIQVVARHNELLLPREAWQKPFKDVDSIYCWEVPFRFCEKGRLWTSAVWVDMETLKIVGGGMLMEDSSEDVGERESNK